MNKARRTKSARHPTKGHFRAITLNGKTALVLTHFFSLRFCGVFHPAPRVFNLSRGANRIRFSRRTLCKIKTDSKAKGGLYCKRFFNPNENSHDAAMF